MVDDQRLRLIVELRDELSKPLDKIDRKLNDFGKQSSVASSGVDKIAKSSKSAAKDASALNNAIRTTNGGLSKATNIAQRGVSGIAKVGSAIKTLTTNSLSGNKAVGGLLKAIQSATPRFASNIASGLKNGLTKAGSALRGVAVRTWEGVTSGIDKVLNSRVVQGVRNGVSKAKSFFVGLVDPAGTSGSKAGRAFGNAMNNAADVAISGIKKSIRGLEYVAAGVLGAIAGKAAFAFTKGFQRLTGLEAAEQTFKSMKYDSKEISGIMKTAEDAVLGTAFALDESAGVAAGMLAANVQPGEELKTVLDAIANTAARSGDSMANTGNVFQKVLATGYLQGDEMNTIMERGIPIITYLADHFGVAESEIRKMVKAGKVSFDDFTQAMLKGTDGAAKAYGETLPGAIANINTALGSTTAMLLKPFYDAVAPMSQALIGVIKNFRDQIEPHAAVMGERLQPVFDAINRWVSGLAKIDFGPIFQTIAQYAPGIGALAGAFVALGSSGLSSMVPFIGAINPLVAIIGGIVLASPALREAIFSIAVQFGGHLFNALKIVTPILVGLITIIANTAGQVLGFVAQNEKLVSILSWVVLGITAVVLAYRGYQIASAFMALALGREVTVTRMKMLSERSAAIATGIHTAAIKAKQIAMTILFGKYGIVTAAQWAWNAAMSANPIGIIIVAIVALVGALIWFFTKTETGKKIWGAVWGWIKDTTAAVVDWFKNTAMPFFQTMWDVLIDGLKAIGNFFVSVWNGIVSGVQAAIQFMQPVFNVITGIFKGIIFVIKLVITIVLTIFVLQWKIAWAIISTTITWAWSIIKPVFTWIKDLFVTTKDRAVSALNMMRAKFLEVWNSIVAITMMIFTPIINWIKNSITWLVVHWKLGWQTISNTVSAVWTWISTTTTAVWTMITGWIMTRLNYLRTMWNYGWSVIRNYVSNVWNSIRNKTMSVFTAITSWIQARLAWVRAIWNNAWSNMRGHISNVWNSIKSVISSTWNWINNNVFSKMRQAVSALGEAFKKFRDTVKGVWDKVEESAKKPVKFVVNTVYRDNVKSTFDKIAGAVGLDLKLPDVKLKGFATGGIMPGYTPGRDVHTVPSPYGNIGLSGGEAIMRPEWTKAVGSGFVNTMNAISRRGVGAVRNAMASMSAPVAGFAKGGTLMDATDWWLGKGARGSRHSRFEGRVVKSGHSRNSLHYQDKAVDFNYGPGGTNKTEMSFFDKWLPEFRRAFPNIRTIWRAPGHYNHLHIDTGRGGRIGDFVRGAGNALKKITDVGPLEKLRNRMRDGVGNGLLPKSIGEMGYKSVQAMLDKINPLNWFGGGDEGDPGDQGGSVGRWKDTVIQALKHVGQSTAGWMVNKVLRRMKQESGGNPKAINNWDSNARRGTPSKGLMQVIGPTFSAYRDKKLGNNIWDPLQNIVASMRYALARYGSLPAAYDRKGGYALGGIFPKTAGLFDNGGILPPGGIALNASNKPELVTSDARAQAEQRAMERATMHAARRTDVSSGSAPVNVEVSISVGSTDGKSMREVEQEFEDMMRRVFDKQNRRG